MARLAAESVVFETAYASVTHTSKALVGILCGMYPRLEMPITEDLENSLPLSCLPHLLLEQGYRVAFLQTALGLFENRPGLVRNMGFQEAAFQETLDGRNHARTGYLGMDEFAMLEPATQWIAAERPEPFFLTLLTVSSHHPYQVPGQPPPRDPDTAPIDYLATVNHLDRFVGAILGGLETAGRAEDTVVIVLGDHGEAFGEHLRMQHDIVPYEEVTRVPLMVRGPVELVGEPRRVGGLRHHTDLVPTVLGLTGVGWSGTLPGKDLFATGGHARVLTSCWFTHTCLGMREKDTKVVFHYGQRKLQVFDLAEDPLELKDLAPSLPPEEVRRWEEEVLAQELWIDAFWAERPPLGEDRSWWAPSN